MTAQELTSAANEMANAALPWMLPPDAVEVANNLAQALAYIDAEPTEAAARLIEHRVKHFGLRVGDVGACAACMARAWNKAATQ